MTYKAPEVGCKALSSGGMYPVLSRYHSDCSVSSEICCLPVVFCYAFWSKCTLDNVFLIFSENNGSIDCSISAEDSLWHDDKDPTPGHPTWDHSVWQSQGPQPLPFPNPFISLSGALFLCCGGHDDVQRRSSCQHVWRCTSLSYHAQVSASDSQGRGDCCLMILYLRDGSAYTILPVAMQRWKRVGVIVVWCFGILEMDLLTELCMLPCRDGRG